jgi:hypothetical protein
MREPFFGSRQFRRGFVHMLVALNRPGFAGGSLV